MAKSMFWCFTENNNARQFWTEITDKCESLSHVKYMCGQLEQGTHVHFQGYIQLGVAQRLSWLKSNISSTAHWEKQKGTNEQARDYCKKVDDTVLPDTFIEYGTFKAGKPGRGARNDIHELRDAIIKGSTQREIIMDEGLVETFAKHIKFADRVRSLFAPPQKDKTDFKISLYFGDPRSGKTRKAKEENPDLYEIPISNGTLWLDGYDSHDVVLFDDFGGRSSRMTLDNTLKFFDRYQRQVPIKGSHAWYDPMHIIVTSNLHPRAWFNYDKREVHWDALWKRFTEVIVFHIGDEPEVQDSVEEFMLDRDLWPQYVVENWDQ